MDDQTMPTIVDQIRRRGRRWDARLSERLWELGHTAAAVREAVLARPLPMLVPIRVRSRTIYRQR